MLSSDDWFTKPIFRNVDSTCKFFMMWEICFLNCHFLREKQNDDYFHTEKPICIVMFKDELKKTWNNQKFVLKNYILWLDCKTV